MIRKAVKEDIEKIMEIIASVVEEMKNYGNTQWDENYPQASNFLGDIEAGDLYVDEVFNEIGAINQATKEIRGFVCVNFVEPKEYSLIKWSSDSSKKQAMVIHRMAVNPKSVNPKFRKQGVGISLLEFSEKLALKTGVKTLKTDTYSINVNMNSLFKKFGFQFAGEMEFLGKEKPFYCYEKGI